MQRKVCVWVLLFTVAVARSSTFPAWFVTPGLMKITLGIGSDADPTSGCVTGELGSFFNGPYSASPTLLDLGLDDLVLYPAPIDPFPVALLACPLVLGVNPSAYLWTRFSCGEFSVREMVLSTGTCTFPSEAVVVDCTLDPGTCDVLWDELPSITLGKGRLFYDVAGNRLGLWRGYGTASPPLEYLVMTILAAVIAVPTYGVDKRPLLIRSGMILAAAFCLGAVAAHFVHRDAWLGTPFPDARVVGILIAIHAFLIGVGIAYFVIAGNWRGSFAQSLYSVAPWAGAWLLQAQAAAGNWSLVIPTLVGVMVVGSWTVRFIDNLMGNTDALLNVAYMLGVAWSGAVVGGWSIYPLFRSFVGPAESGAVTAVLLTVGLAVVALIVASEISYASLIRAKQE